MRRFGQRRRQCQACHKTWRVWAKKRGRKRRRSDDSVLLTRYLNSQLSLSGHAARQDTPSHRGLSARLRVARDDFTARTAWVSVLSEPSIIIADAFEATIAGVTQTGYLGLVRACRNDQAVILPPFYQLGKETAAGWDAAFASFTPYLSQVHALVCDGAVGLTRQAAQRDWVLQRCQFHLWHALNNYVRIPRQGKPQAHAALIHHLVRVAMESGNDEKAFGAVCQLEALLPELRSRGAHKVLRGFVGHWLDYRSFLYHDKLNLPKTSNCAEQTICVIRRLQQSARGWSSHEALQAWAEAVLKHQQTVVCRASDASTKLI